MTSANWLRAREWMASPRHVRVFHGATSTVIDRDVIDAAKREVMRDDCLGEVTVAGLVLDESDIDAMRAGMTRARQRQMEDARIDDSLER